MRAGFRRLRRARTTGPDPLDQHYATTPVAYARGVARVPALAYSDPRQDAVIEALEALEAQFSNLADSYLEEGF